MQSSSPTMIGMDLEDFRRLGVRPHETRLTVIRLAALRSAKALAAKQLKSPSEQVGIQLSRVATSAYRLLDPRQREDEIQRAHVGRIFPKTLDWAGQTRFHDSSGKASVETVFSRDSMTDMELIAMLDLDGPSRYEDEVQSWTASLSDEDLLASASRTSAVDRLRVYLRTPWILGVVAGLFVGAILGLWTLRTTDSSRADRLPSSAELAVAEFPELPSRGLAEPTLESTELESTELESHGVLDELAAAAPTTMESPLEIDLLIPSTAELAPIPALETWIDSPDDVTGDSAGNDEIRETNARPAETLTPTEAQVRTARRRLKSLLPELERAPIPSEVASTIDKIGALQHELKVGSPERWVAQMMIAELAWLVEDGPQVSNRLQWLADNDGVPRSDLLSQSFVAACALASLPETHQHLLDNGLRLADRLLVSESFEACRVVLTAIGPSAETLESEISLDEMKNLAEAVTQAARLARSSQRGLDESPIVGRDLGVVGRYYCFMLRRWDTGLPWLTAVSDSRMASVARQEVEMRDSPTPGETIDVSQRWLSIADRSRGRVSDSIRLHAVDLMQDAVSQTSGLKKLELERGMEEVLEKLPSYLRADVTSSSDVTSAAASTATPAAPTELVAATPKLGLSGRIGVAGRDIGVQLDYEVGAAFSRSLLGTIAQRVDKKLARPVLRFDGEFELLRPSRILVSIAPNQNDVGPSDASQLVQVDGKTIRFEESQASAEIAFNAGTHRLSWRIEGDNWGDMAIRLRDAATGEAVKVVHPSRIEGAAQTTLTVAIVRGTP